MTREEAVETLKANYPDSCYGQLCEAVDVAIETLEKTNVRGEWVQKHDPYGFFEEIPVCSVCGCTTKMRETYNFCPNCGADMRKKGEKNESI